MFRWKIVATFKRIASLSKFILIYIILLKLNIFLQIENNQTWVRGLLNLNLPQMQIMRKHCWHCYLQFTTNETRHKYVIISDVNEAHACPLSCLHEAFVLYRRRVISEYVQFRSKKNFNSIYDQLTTVYHATYISFSLVVCSLRFGKFQVYLRSVKDALSCNMRRIWYSWVNGFVENGEFLKLLANQPWFEQAVVMRMLLITIFFLISKDEREA